MFAGPLTDILEEEQSHSHRHRVLPARDQVRSSQPDISTQIATVVAVHEIGDTVHGTESKIPAIVSPSDDVQADCTALGAKDKVSTAPCRSGH